MNHYSITHEDIRFLAHQLWELRGSPIDDHPEQDWFAALDKLRAENARDAMDEAPLGLPHE
jgi:hypothetical protein